MVWAESSDQVVLQGRDQSMVDLAPPSQGTLSTKPGSTTHQIRPPEPEQSMCVTEVSKARRPGLPVGHL